MARFGVIIVGCFLVWHSARPVAAQQPTPPDLIGAWVTGWDTTGIRCYGYKKNKRYSDRRTLHAMVLLADSTLSTHCNLHMLKDPKPGGWGTQSTNYRWRLVGDTIVAISAGQEHTRYGIPLSCTTRS